MEHYQKYAKGYFMPPEPCYDWTRKENITEPPIWCSVDLRDGNQALVVPMSLEQKLEFFTFLCEVGFKEIEVGFPAASQTEYDFLRALIDRNLIPDDVTIQVLTQSREHIIAKTFEALAGCKRAVVHLYNSTSVAQREQVFRKDKQQIIEIAQFGAKLCKEYAAKTPGNFMFEYSPESFTGTEPEFALDICNAVIDIWQPDPEHKVIINLPVTVEMSMPHVYACQVEYMHKHLNRRDSVIISLHPHNDRGCAVADTELGLLAGGDRVEGTLFGNGERTGNVDIITVALNMYSHGVDPKLHFENLPMVIGQYERATGMHVYERQPYSGRLVFAAFSGSHQDAIAKGMKWIEEKHPDKWSVPYLPIDPKDVGRQYESDVIRINSQSGKGGIGFLLEKQFGFNLPQKMRERFGYEIKDVSDRGHKELMPQEIFDYFVEHYVNLASPLKIYESHFRQNSNGISAEVSLEYDGKIHTCKGDGNGRLDAANHAISGIIGREYSIEEYHEHALTSTSKSQAVAYVCLRYDTDKLVWGVGIHTDIVTATISALVSAINRMQTQDK